jgi:hypothetical protein
MLISRSRFAFALTYLLVTSVHAAEVLPPWASNAGLLTADAASGRSLVGGAAHGEQAKEKETPRCNADCVRANMERATQACARRIEAEAPIDFEWISRPFGGIFAEADPSSATSSVVPYRGDAVRFLNPQKEWIRIAYQCAYDVAERKVVDLRIRPGRLHQAQQGQVQDRTPPPLIESGPREKVESAKLAEAIQQAVRQRQAQDKAAQPPGPKALPIGEMSDIEIRQVTPNRRP